MKALLQHKNPQFLLYQGGFYILIMLLLTVIVFQNLPPQIPLFYSRPDGDSQVVDTIYIVLIPILLLATTILNFFLSKKHFHTDEPIKSILFITTISVNTLLLIVFIRIIFLIT